MRWFFFFCVFLISFCTSFIIRNTENFIICYFLIYLFTLIYKIFLLSFFIFFTN